MTLPTISAFPSPPARTDVPTDFNTKADAFLAAFPGFVTEVNAWAAALPATITGTDYSASSTTSLTIGTGSKSLTVQTGKQFQVGQPVRIAYTTTPANYMDGQVTSYNSGTGALVVNVTAVGGSGTQAVWTIALIPGAGGSYATLTGTETLTNKSLTNPIISGADQTVAGKMGFSVGYLTYGDGTVTQAIASAANSMAFTNKVLDFGVGGNVGKINGNTLAAPAGTATITFFNSSDTVVGRATTDTLTNKTLTAPTINNGTATGTVLAGGTIQAGNTVNDTGTIAAASPGFRGLPASSQSQGSAITLALADAGKSVPNTSGGWSIPDNTSIAFPVGTVIELFNNSGSSQNIAMAGTDTLRLAGTGTTGTRALAQYGSAILTKRTSTMWTVGGAGVS